MMNTAKIQLTPKPHSIGSITNAPIDSSQLISVPNDCDIKVSPRYKDYFGRFQAISPLRTSELDKPDLFDILASLSRPSFRVFNQLKLRRNLKNSLCHCPVNKLSRSEQVMFNGGVRELVAKKIVKRVPVSNKIVSVKKNTYMFNPEMIRCQKYQAACVIWSQLKN